MKKKIINLTYYLLMCGIDKVSYIALKKLLEDFPINLDDYTCSYGDSVSFFNNKDMNSSHKFARDWMEE